jgi:hypothetical protein
MLKIIMKLLNKMFFSTSFRIFEYLDELIKLIFHNQICKVKNKQLPDKIVYFDTQSIQSLIYIILKSIILFR